MQVLHIAGNVGKDAVLRRLQNGDAVLGFSVAVDNGKDKDGNARPPTWYECSLWGKRAESLERYITKGNKLALYGSPSVRVHEGKAYLGLRVDQLTFQGGSQANGDDRRGDRSDAPAPQSSGGYSSGPDDDEIPFEMSWR